MSAHAIFIGTDEYRDSQIQKLSFAASDARELYGLFKHGLDYGDRAVLLEEPSVDQVVQAVDSARRLVEPGDSFFLYFAGHGVEAPGRDDQLLLLSGARLDLLRPGATSTPVGVLSVSMLLSLTDEWDDVDRVFVFDACRTPLETTRRPGGAGEFGREASLDHLVAERRVGAQERTSPPRVAAEKQARPPVRGLGARPPVFIKSCMYGQTALEVARLRRGLFSWALGAELAACREHGEQVSAGVELIERLSDRMSELARREGLNRAQKPWISSGAPPVEIAMGRRQIAAIPEPAAVAAAMSISSSAASAAVGFARPQAVVGAAVGAPPRTQLPPRRGRSGYLLVVGAVAVLAAAWAGWQVLRFEVAPPAGTAPKPVVDQSTPQRDASRQSDAVAPQLRDAQVIAPSMPARPPEAERAPPQPAAELPPTPKVEPKVERDGAMTPREASAAPQRSAEPAAPSPSPRRAPPSTRTEARPVSQACMELTRLFGSGQLSKEDLPRLKEACNP